MNWVEKLTSRKLWMAFSSFVVMLLIAFGVKESEATQIAAIIMAGASVIGYVIGEGLVDASRVKGDMTVSFTQKDDAGAE